jgi:type IV secretion system protein TrbG
MNKTFCATAFGTIIAAASSSTYAIAQDVPAIQRAAPLQTGHVSKYVTPPIVLSADTVKLDLRQQKGISLSEQWNDKSTMPFLGEDGSVQFEYGATFPSIVCAPLYACDVALQQGEVIRQVMLGDASRWRVSPGTSGSGDNIVAHLVIKPADVGLSTNLVIYTDRRSYSIRLVSKKDQWMPLVSFSYPDDTQAQWASYRAQQKQQLKGKATYSQPPAVNTELSFNYRIKGDSPKWRPIRVYAEGAKTYIQFPANVKNDQTPALVILNSANQAQMVNYRMLDDRYVVDQVIEKAALIRGVGRHQERVEIAREGSQS